MTYSLLAPEFHETANAAKVYFAKEHGAKSFKCELALRDDLPLRPTWHALLPDQYQLVVEVRATPFTPTLHEFVNRCAVRGLPVKLWVAVGELNSTSADFTRGLRDAKEVGVGVVQLVPGSDPYVFLRPVPASLFALRRANLKPIKKRYRAVVSDMEETFLDGRPEEGCRRVCEELEAITRRFGRKSYDLGWWKKSVSDPDDFFSTGSWATMLRTMDEAIDEQKARSKCPDFRRIFVTSVRSYTDFRNSLSHKPQTSKQRKQRDEKLRTMFEVTRDLLISWFSSSHPLKLDI